MRDGVIRLITAWRSDGPLSASSRLKSAEPVAGNKLTDVTLVVFRKRRPREPLAGRRDQVLAQRVLLPQ